MKYLLSALIAVSFLAEAWSLTCYRCSTSPDCPAGNATVECESPSLPDAVYGCQVYTVNYTSLNSVKTFKSCCFYEDCNKDPCKAFNDSATVCSKMASCQSDKCNYDYDTAKASPQPTLPKPITTQTTVKPQPTASGIVFSSAAGLVMTLASLVLSI